MEVSAGRAVPACLSAQTPSPRLSETRPTSWGVLLPWLHSEGTRSGCLQGSLSARMTQPLQSLFLHPCRGHRGPPGRNMPVATVVPCRRTLPVHSLRPKALDLQGLGDLAQFCGERGDQVPRLRFCSTHFSLTNNFAQGQGPLRPVLSRLPFAALEVPAPSHSTPAFQQLSPGTRLGHNLKRNSSDGKRNRQAAILGCQPKDPPLKEGSMT